MSDPTTISPTKRSTAFPIKTGLSVFKVGRAKAQLRHFEDAAFHQDSAVLLPDSGALRAGQPDPDRITGIGVLATCIEHAGDNAQQEILVAGHADGKGSPDDARSLALARANNVLHLLRGDQQAWVKVAEAHSQVKDYKQMLKWVAFIWAWPCDPGALTNVHDAATTDALARFQKLAAAEFGTSLAADGKINASTWGAFFSLYMRTLALVLKVSADELTKKQAELKFVPKQAVGCGRGAAKHVVQVVFFEPDELPKLACHPTAQSCKRDKCDLYRRKDGHGGFALKNLPCPPLRLPGFDFSTKLVEIAGLYQPKATAVVGAHQSDHVEGYTSGDDKGRIFVNHAPGSGPDIDWDSLRSKDTQYIELTARVVANNGQLHPDTVVQWTWEDPDDGPMDDNAGKRDFPSPAAGIGAKFAAVAGHAIKRELDDRSCETGLVEGTSRIRLHLTNVAGDNFRVTVAAKDPRGGATAPHSTGVMTVWKRIDVEYKTMEGAEDKLPAQQIPGAFEPCFVQMDLHGPESVGGALTRQVMLEDPNASLCDTCRKYTDTIFKNAGKPGWFLLLAAHHSRSVATAKTLFEGEARVKEASARPSGYGGAVLIVNKALRGKDQPSSARYVEGSNSITLGLSRSAKVKGGRTFFHAYPLDYQPDFDKDAADGAVKTAYARRHMYYPTHMVKVPGGAIEHPGLGFSGTPQVRVASRGSSFTIGISPTLKKIVGGTPRGFFAGRTIIFTAKGSKSRMLEVIVHEFAHAFGFPHKCGHYAAPSGSKDSCVMNYFNTWVFAEGTTTIEKRFHTGASGIRLCQHHIDGVRRVHLEDNVALWKWT